VFWLGLAVPHQWRYRTHHDTKNQKHQQASFKIQNPYRRGIHRLNRLLSTAHITIKNKNELFLTIILTIVFKPILVTKYLKDRSAK
jgi:hypothetical protein